MRVYETNRLGPNFSINFIKHPIKRQIKRLQTKSLSSCCCCCCFYMCVCVCVGPSMDYQMKKVFSCRHFFVSKFSFFLLLSLLLTISRKWFPSKSHLLLAKVLSSSLCRCLARCCCALCHTKGDIILKSNII